MKLSKIALASAMFFVQVGYGAEALPEALKSCISLKHDTERLTCFDRAVAHLLSGDAEAPALSAENMFGANAVIAPQASQPETPREDLRQITAKVVSLKHLEDKRLVLALDNNQVWLQQDNEAVLTFENGDSITISRASLGTFRITDTRGRSSRFRRVR